LQNRKIFRNRTLREAALDLNLPHTNTQIFKIRVGLAGKMLSRRFQPVQDLQPRLVR
jgi:hypothetical protein